MRISRLRRLPIMVMTGFVLVCAPSIDFASSVKAEETQPFEPGATFSGNYLAGRLAYSVKDAAAAATFFRSAIGFDPDDVRLFDDTLILEVAAGHEDEAIALAQRMIEKDRSNRLARLLLATKAMRGRQYVQARKHLAETNGNPLADLTSGLAAAWAHVGTNDPKGAYGAINSIEDGGSADIDKLKAYHTGLIAAVVGDRDKAEASLARAYDADNKVLRVVQAYARILAANDKMDKAREVLEGFDAALPRHPIIRAAIDDVAAGRMPENDLMTAQEGAAEVFYGLGSALGRDAADRLGSVYLRLAIMLDPKAVLPLVTLASYVEQEGVKARALEIYDHVPQSSPLALTAMISRARVLADMDRVDDAVAALRVLVADHPADAEAAVALGDVLRDKERFEDAADAYSVALKRVAPIDQPDWVLLYFRGMSYERAKQWPKAEADLQKALELQPDHPFVLNYLGYSWVDQGLYLDKALSMIKKAVELRPNDGYIVDSLGWAYYKLGRWEEAVEQLERAVELRPQDPILNDHLGDAYFRAGRRLEARFQWNHARDLDPEPADLKKILEKIENGLPPLDAESQAAQNSDGG